MSGIDVIQDIWGGFDFTYILSILLSVVPSLLCITFHELSHGFVAYKLGDDTAKRAGRLTLNADASSPRYTVSIYANADLGDAEDDVFEEEEADPDQSERGRLTMQKVMKNVKYNDADAAFDDGGDMDELSDSLFNDDDDMEYSFISSTRRK